MCQKQEIDELRAISQHCLQNAWCKVRFNQGNDRGIHGATPSELLHAILLGMFKCTRDVFFEMIGKDSQLAEDINGLAKTFGQLFSHQSDRSFGNTNFSKGIKEGKIMAKDFRGVLLNIAAVLRSTEGRNRPDTRKKFRQESTKDDWLMLVETLLQWEAFLNLPKMHKKHVHRLARKNKHIMFLMTKIARRCKGMGLKMLKFHTTLHMAEDILLHGVPLEFETAPNESHHKPSKHAAKLTQMNATTFNVQVANRLYEWMVLDLALQEIEEGKCRWHCYVGSTPVGAADPTESSADPPDSEAEVEEMEVDTEVLGSDEEMQEEASVETCTGGAGIEVFWDEDGERPSFQMTSRSKSKKSTKMGTSLVRFLCNLQSKVRRHIDGASLPTFTEHTRGNAIFRGHPNYLGAGPWRDWAIIDWGPDYGELPTHTWCFVDLSGYENTGTRAVEHGGVDLEPCVCAVVESTTHEMDDKHRASELFVPLRKDAICADDEETKVRSRVFHLAKTDAIVRPCCVIPDIGGPQNRHHYVLPRNIWAGIFTKWVEEPHKDDEIECLETEDEEDQTDTEEEGAGEEEGDASNESDDDNEKDAVRSEKK